MKKALALLLALCLCLTLLAGCAKTAEPEKTDKPAEQTTEKAEEKTEEKTEEKAEETKEAEAPAEEDADKYGGTFVWAQTSDPNTLLYAWITSGFTNRMSSFINDKLFIIDSQGNITYRICDNMEVSDDSLVYTFHVRDGVKWHDGTPVLASDIVWTKNIQYDPNWFMALQQELPGEWEVVDDQTFTVTLDEPNPTVLWTICDLMFPQPEHYWADVDPANFFSCEKATHPIGCGPFKFVEYKVGDYIAMEAFDDFWNGRPYLDNAFIKITGGADYTQIGFEAGEISAMSTTEDYYEEIKDNDQFQFVIGSSTNLCGVFFENCYYRYNDTEHEVLRYCGDPIIREALGWAVPYEEITDKVLRGACERSYSAVPNDCAFFTEEGMERYEYDIDKANQILDDAGYVDTDGDGVRNWKDGSNIQILWTFYGAGSTNERMSILMAENCNKIGIASGLNSEEQTTWVDTLLGEQTFDPDKQYSTASIYYYGGYGSIPYDYENCYSSWGGQSEYIDWETGEPLPEETMKACYDEKTLEALARIDECFKKMHTTDEDAARAAFEEFQRIEINDLRGIIPIGSMQARYGFQANIRGLEDCLWFTNNNYLGFAMEKVWIEK